MFIKLLRTTWELVICGIKGIAIDKPARKKLTAFHQQHKHAKLNQRGLKENEMAIKLQNTQYEMTLSITCLLLALVFLNDEQQK